VSVISLARRRAFSMVSSPLEWSTRMMLLAMPAGLTDNHKQVDPP